jgi:hypothetical protein
LNDISLKSFRWPHFSIIKLFSTWIVINEANDAEGALIDCPKNLLALDQIICVDSTRSTSTLGRNESSLDKFAKQLGNL